MKYEEGDKQNENVEEFEYSCLKQLCAEDKLIKAKVEKEYGNRNERFISGL